MWPTSDTKHSGASSSKALREAPSDRAGIVPSERVALNHVLDESGGKQAAPERYGVALSLAGNFSFARNALNRLKP